MLPYTKKLSAYYSLAAAGLIFLAALTGCKGMIDTPDDTGTVSLGINRINPVLMEGTGWTAKEFDPGDKGMLFVEEVSVTITGDSEGLVVDETYSIDGESQVELDYVLNPDNYTITVEIYNDNVDPANPVVSGSGTFSLSAGAQETVEVFCTPWNPSNLGEGDNSELQSLLPTIQDVTIENVTIGGEAWFEICPSTNLTTFEISPSKPAKWGGVGAVFDDTGVVINTEHHFGSQRRGMYIFGGYGVPSADAPMSWTFETTPGATYYVGVANMQYIMDGEILVYGGDFFVSYSPCTTDAVTVSNEDLTLSGRLGGELVYGSFDVSSGADVVDPATQWVHIYDENYQCRFTTTDPATVDGFSYWSDAEQELVIETDDAGQTVYAVFETSTPPVDLSGSFTVQSLGYEAETVNYSVSFTDYAVVLYTAQPYLVVDGEVNILPSPGGSETSWVGTHVQYAAADLIYIGGFFEIDSVNHYTQPCYWIYDNGMITSYTIPIPSGDSDQSSTINDFAVVSDGLGGWEVHASVEDDSAAMGQSYWNSMEGYGTDFTGVPGTTGSFIPLGPKEDGGSLYIAGMDDGDGSFWIVDGNNAVLESGLSFPINPFGGNAEVMGWIYEAAVNDVYLYGAEVDDVMNPTTWTPGWEVDGGASWTAHPGETAGTERHTYMTTNDDFYTNGAANPVILGGSQQSMELPAGAAIDGYRDIFVGTDAGTNEDDYVVGKFTDSESTVFLGIWRRSAMLESDLVVAIAADDITGGVPFFLLRDNTCSDFWE
jgi:hypothetical protein